jgi:hypothetical protein
MYCEFPCVPAVRTLTLEVAAAGGSQGRSAPICP